MSGSRMIHDNVCDSKKLSAVGFEAGELWFRLVTRADDNGNYYRDALRVYATVMPEKKGCTQESTEKALKELEKIGLIVVYEADGRKYLHISNWENHQTLRQDFPAQIAHPIHPSELGTGYTTDGVRRSQCFRTAEEPQDNRTTTDKQPNTDRTQTKLPVTAEVEVKDKGEVEVPTHSTHHDGNFKKFQEAFKDALGRATKPKPYDSHVARYTELCQRFGESEVLDAINAFVGLHGKAQLYKNKFADRNFLMDEAEDLIQAKQTGNLNPPQDEEPEEIAKMPSGGPSLPKELML